MTQARDGKHIVKIEDEMKKLIDEKERKKDKQLVSFDVVIAYAKYFLQHIEYLLLQQCDPIKKASFLACYLIKHQATQKFSLQPII